MSEKVLIIRSASLQQLDQNLPAIREFFPDCQIDLLTHPHNLVHCRKYKDIGQILAYNTSGNYSWRYCPAKVIRSDYKAVLVLVANVSGAGFLNVQLLATRLKAKEIYLCNLRSELIYVSRRKIFLKLLRNLVIFPLVCLLFIPISVLGMGWLVLSRIFTGSAKRP